VILLLACAPDDGGRESADALPFEPLSGSYVVTMAPEFEGCALADPATGHVADDHWDFLVDGDGIRWWGNDQPSRWGAMDGLDFFFDLGTYVTDFGAYGYDAVEAVTYSLAGTFDSPTSFGGSYDVALACDGDACDFIGKGWGSGFTYPCVAEAPFVGTAE
jgi:hypothetical protein